MIAALSKAWRDAQEQIRIHRGKPLPGSLTHEKVKRGARVARNVGASMLATLAAQAADVADEQPAAEPMQPQGDVAQQA